MRITILSLLALALLVPGACSPSGPAAASQRAACSGETTFCLRSCSLGCSIGTCNITDIAANQPIILNFSQDVDLSSVDFSTVSIKTANGRTPEVELQTQGATIRIVPTIKVSGGFTSFGFASGETYILTLPTGADSQMALRSVTGDLLSGGISCNLRVTRGIVDLNGLPPTAKMISPEERTNVRGDTVITLEFSEIIDIAPFRGATTETSPIRYFIRKTKQIPGAGPRDRTCDLNFTPLVLEGLPKAETIPGRNVSIVTLRPSVALPSQICVEVLVTGQVTDLSGTPAVPQSFIFTTEILVAGVGKLSESFSDAGMLDKAISSGIWGGGKALPPQVGGTGLHGSFEATIGVTAGPDARGKPRPSTYIWNTDKFRIPGSLTETGEDIEVTDGIFHFTNFHLPSNLTVIFEGSNPVRINVRGSAEIDGKILANAPLPLFFQAASTLGSAKSFGQAGMLGGTGGGKGGQGADACLNSGSTPPPGRSFNGRDGGDVKLPGGNGYGTAAQGTGGKGSKLHPLTGITGTYCALGGVFGGEIAAGGGGGGFNARGSGGKGIKSPCTGTGLLGDNSNGGGKAFDIAALTPNGTSLDHFLIGGSGGGGGGSHPYLTTKQYASPWIPGSSGAGGGGAVSIRVGQDLSMRSSSRIEVRGGEGYFINGVSEPWEKAGDILFNVPAPGGGGSGGTIFLQVFGDVSLAGLLDTSGGKAGVLDLTRAGQPQLTGKSTGGDGSAGYVRVETKAGAKVFELGITIPKAGAGNIGFLTDTDDKTVSQSKFYPTGLTFPPEYLRYVVEAEINGVPKVYSDDPQLGDPKSPLYRKEYSGMASATDPLYFRVQGAKVSTITGLPDLKTLGPWRDYVGLTSVTTKTLNADKATGARFQLVFNQSGTQTIVVTKVDIFYKE